MSEKHESANVKSLRNQLREKALAATRGAKPNTITLKIDGEETTFDVIRASVEKRSEILKAAGYTGDDDKRNPAKLQAVSIVELVVFPGTRDPVFELADVEAILQADAGGWPDLLWEAVQRAVNVDAKEEAKK